MKLRTSILVAGILLVGAAAIAGRLWTNQIAMLVTYAARNAHALGAAGWALAGGTQILIALCGILPASVGGFACGLAYGIIGGFLLSASATLAAAMVAFWLSRSLFRPLIVRLLSRNPRIAGLEAAVARDGWRLVALLRCSPIMPFAITSYAFGLTSISPRAYLGGTLAAMPALLGYVLLGDLAARGAAALSTNQQHDVHFALLILAIAATALLTWRMGRIVHGAVGRLG